MASDDTVGITNQPEEHQITPPDEQMEPVTGPDTLVTEGEIPSEVETPAEQTPAEQTPAEETPAEETPAEEDAPATAADQVAETPSAAAAPAGPAGEREGAPKAEGRPTDVEELKEGMRLRGRVRNIVEFGAFVDLGVGRDGLAHISTLQRAGIDKTLKVGDMLDVQIRKVDLEHNRISLTVPGAGRGAKSSLESLKAGQEIVGRVVRLVDFGAFVDIGAQTDGLLHISQLSGSFVNHPREVVDVGQEVRVRILEVDMGRRRISLTMKDATGEDEDAPDTAPAAPQAQEDRGPGAFAAAWQEALRSRRGRDGK
jgi:small subunit ribosomal protein S1